MSTAYLMQDLKEFRKLPRVDLKTMREIPNSRQLCHDLDDPLAGYAAKYSLLDADTASRVSFSDFCKCAELIAPNTESVKRRPRE